MVKYRVHITILMITFLYWLNKLLADQVDSLFFSNHFSDLLFIPLVSFIGLLGVQTIKRDKSLQISVWQIVILVLLSSLYFEWYLPSYSANKNWYTSDLFDCIMYLTGGGLFLLLQRVIIKPTLKSSQSEKMHSEWNQHH